MATIDNYVIEQFTLKDEDIKNLSELITSSFLKDEAAQKEGASIVFTEDTFRIIFGSPRTDRELFVRARYKPTNEIVGFLGTIPRNLKVENNFYKCQIPSWLAVHWQHQRKGIGKEMGKKMLELGINKGYDAGFALHEPEQKGINTSQAVARETKTPLVRMASITKYVIRVFDAEATASVVKVKWYEKLVFKLMEKTKAVKSNRVRVYQKKDFEQLFALLSDLTNKKQIAIAHDSEDIKRLLDNPKVLCVVHEDKDGKLNGFVMVWEFSLAGFGNIIPFGWLDVVHTYNLTTKEATELAKCVGINAKKLGWKGIQTPYIPYFEAKPFQKANFIFFNKKLSLDLFKLKDIYIPEKIESFFFDWR